ncbi:MAG: Ppx/GppA family phosphatase [Microbacteriaceae bacterium]|nr:Ppx/GppA family phosphatase [Microbacteriaceae bacterium]
MRLGVIDVGSNTVHLLVVDAHPGASPAPYHSQRELLRLMQYLEPDGSIAPEGVARIVAAIDEAVRQAREIGVDDLILTVTSAIREASNGSEVLRLVETQVGELPQVLSGEDEARLTMLAVRRWLGWSAGEILLFDIGGGSFEIAQGSDEYPDVQVSLPLGSGRVTKQYLPDDPPAFEKIEAVRDFASSEFRRVRELLFRKRPAPDCVVGTSKTIRSLGKLVGGPGDPATGERATLKYDNLAQWEPVLARMPGEVREYLPGITPERGYQMLAGAVLLRTAMDVFDVPVLQISPWALREGIVLRYIDHLDERPADPVSLVVSPD